MHYWFDKTNNSKRLKKKKTVERKHTAKKISTIIINYHDVEQKKLKQNMHCDM